MTEEQGPDPGEISYAEQFYPARPRSLRHRARVKDPVVRRPVHRVDGLNPAYVAWLLSQSMLSDANEISRQFSGQGSMWQNPFANPGPRQAVDTASVWFTAYPISLITKPGESFLATLGREKLWEAFSAIGIDAVHTGPVKRAGGIDGWNLTPSVDGHFDRISTEIDPAFGNEDEFRLMCETASLFGGTVIDDVVPGHTGKGADFRLAEMKHGDYPGIYHMVEISPDDWGDLPDIAPGRDSANIDAATEEKLEKSGYIIGRLQRVIFYAEGVKETNWSATRPVVGVDGVERRWVYLHYFKEGQPSINWLDPSFAGMRMVIGDALHSLGDLGTGALRLDANGFLGVEKSSEGMPAWSEGHPLSDAANQMIAGMVRKVGGFTFQELNLTIDDIRETAQAGADLSYDFVNRPAYHHALATGDTEFLRLTLRTSLELGVEPASLVHALQNHDELTYELVHWATGHREDVYEFRGAEITGGQLAEAIRQDLCDHLTGDAAPYNRVFTTNGIACTTASVITAVLGYPDVSDLSEDDVERVRRAHLLLAMFNAWQPGVFALSGWDLCGMLTVDAAQVAPLVADGDTRWIHRGAHDLMGHDPDATVSASGMPRGVSLYGTLPDQIRDETSFARRLAKILAVRREHGIAVGRQVDVPDVSQRGMLVMVHALDGHALDGRDLDGRDLDGRDLDGRDLDGRDLDGRLQLTVLNFAAEAIAGTVRSEHLPPGATVTDMITGEEIASVDNLRSFAMELDVHQGVSLLVTPQRD